MEEPREHEKKVETREREFSMGELMKGSQGYGRMEENGDGFMNAAKATRRIRSSFARLEVRLPLSHKWL